MNTQNFSPKLEVQKIAGDGILFAVDIQEKLIHQCEYIDHVVNSIITTTTNRDVEEFMFMKSISDGSTYDYHQPKYGLPPRYQKVDEERCKIFYINNVKYDDADKRFRIFFEYDHAFQYLKEIISEQAKKLSSQVEKKKSELNTLEKELERLNKKVVLF